MMKQVRKTKWSGLPSLTLLVGVVMTSVMVSCSEEDQRPDVSTTPTASASVAVLEETTFIENLFSSLSWEIDDAISLPADGSAARSGDSGCRSRTVETPEGAEYPMVVTVVYSDSCTTRNGTTMKGTIVTTVTGPRNEVGTEVSTTFEDFYVNDYKVAGTQRYVVESEAVKTTSLENASVTTPEGETFGLTSTQTREITSGLDTEDRSDDVYSTTGSSSGTTLDGVSYSQTITSPLISSRECRWTTQGTIESVIGEVTTVYDFGDGTCDNVATSTVDGVTEEILMDFRRNRNHRHH